MNFRFHLAAITVGMFLAASSRAADSVTAADRYHQGTSVNYRLTTSDRQLYFALSGVDKPLPQDEPEILTCRLTVLKNDRGKLQFDMEVFRNSVLLNNATLNDYPLNHLLPAEKSLSAGVAVTKTLPATTIEPEREITATEIVLSGAGKKIKITKSDIVPFQVIEITCGAFHLELLDYHW